MNRIFFRMAPLILLAIAVAAVAIYFAIRFLFSDPLEEIARKQAAGPIFLLEHYIDQAPADEWLVRLNKVREISGLVLELIPLADAASRVEENKRGTLQRGDVLLDIAGKMLYRRVDLAGAKYVGSADDVLQMGNLPIDVGLELKMDALRYLIVALCVLMPIAIWSRIHWLELLALSEVADRFGEGRLSVRADTKASSGIYPLAQCMNQMAERVEGLLAAHRSLLHSVSHELRTPISRMEFGLELLRTSSGKEDRESRIRVMEDDVRELNTLVNELLNIAKLEQDNALRTERFALADVLRDYADKLVHIFAGKQFDAQISLHLGDIRGDRRLIARAVGNLLVNAAKYADQKVQLSATRRSDSVEIIVDDDGPGIPPADRKKVFEPFYRLDRSRDRKTGGFGLGLAIAQKAVLLHGGEIIAAESPLGGARFMLRLPVSNVGKLSAESTQTA